MKTYLTVRTRRAHMAVLALGATALSSTLADAHFRLIAPGNFVVQSSDGSPQKAGPCGNESPQTATNIVTAFRPGDTVTIQLEETVYHPGHYRVALAVNSPNELPAEPPVTAGSSACGSVPIQQTPVFPVLADGMLVHTTPFTGQQSFQVKLPTNVTCTACTLQIIEFMSSHGAPCFYHHCAKISIQDGATDGGAGTSDAARDSSGGAGGALDSGATGGRAGASGGGAGTSPTGGSGGATGGGAGSGASGGVGGAGTTGGSAGSGGAVGVGGSGTTGGSTSTGAGGAGAIAGASGTAGGAAGEGGAGGSGVETTGYACALSRADAPSLGAVSTVLGLAFAVMRRRRRRF